MAWHLYFTVFLVHVAGLVVNEAWSSCPDQTPGLKRWSHSSSWPNTQVPGKNSRVVIRDAILLDETTPELESITIEAGGRLVWSSEGDFTLTTQYIMVNGRMDIGSEDCKFDRKAHIILIGIKGSYSYTYGHHLLGEKFIGVGHGGTLELHGREKLSWTKLTKTVPRLTKETGLLYEHQHMDISWRVGLHVYIMDGETGKVISFRTFHVGEYNDYFSAREPGQFVNLLQNAKDGNIIMMAIKDNLIDPKVNLDPIFDAIETLTDGHVTHNGLIRQVKREDTYAFVMQKGAPSTLSEKIGTNFHLKSQRATVSLTLWDKGLKFTAESYIDNEYRYKTDVHFRVMTTSGAYNIINVVDDVSSWQPGDKVILTSTDYHWEQVEEATVMQCLSCNSNQLKLDLEVKFVHWGEMIDGVDERGEVALLTRNILIEGRMEDTCPPSNGNCDQFEYDTFGGHVKIMKGFKNVHIEGVELFHMGQQMHKGFYPLHFHMCEDVDEVGNYDNPPWLRRNSIHNTFSRCVTIHGTHGATVQDNVAYDHLGHCYFLEDGGEKRNVFDGNLGAATKKGTVLPSDARPSTFWMTCPLVYLRNNVAAGGEAMGIWYVYPIEPMGPSFGKGFMQKDEAKYTALLEFNNNVVHSNSEAGMMMDNNILPDESVPLGSDSHNYARTDPLDKTSPAKEVLFYRLTAFKNKFENVWIRGALYIVDRASLADSGRGITLARVALRQFLTNSILIGESRNLGDPSKKWDGTKDVYMPRSIPLDWDQHNPITGVKFYPGPVYVKNVWFSGFKTNVNYTAGAVGFERNNKFSSSPDNSVTNIKFDFVDGISTGNRLFDGDVNDHLFTNFNGDKGTTLRDLDGSLTGHRGATVVKPGPFTHNPRCYLQPNWKMEICPQRFGTIAVESKDHKGIRPFMVRDENPTVRMTSTWEMSASFPVTLGGHYSYTLNWEGKVPQMFDIIGAGMEKDQWVRVGVCLPRDGKFHLELYSPVYRSDTSSYSQWTVATSISEMESDPDGASYFWDKQTGLMFFKLVNLRKRVPADIKECPGNCPYVHIEILSGNLDDRDCSSRAYGPYKRTPTSDGPALHKIQLPVTASTPPKNWGAGSTRPFQTRVPVNGQFGRWSAWTTCSNTCGIGIQTRTRSCDDKEGTDDCQKSLLEHRHCNKLACPGA